MSQFKGKVKEIVSELQERRSVGKEEITMRQLLEEKYDENNTLEHLYYDNDIDPYKTTINDLFADEDKKYLVVDLVREGIQRGMGKSQRQLIKEFRESLSTTQGTVVTDRQTYITPEIFLDPVQRGNVQASFFQDLIIDEIPVDSDQVTVPQIDLSDSEVKDRTEAQTIETGTVVYGKKTVKVVERARGLKMSYEAFRRHKLNFANIYFEHLGRRLGSKLNQDLATVLTNGDQADSSESCAVIGVTTPNTLTYADVTRAFIRLSLLGIMPNAIVASEKMANLWLNLTEVKNRQQGTPLINSQLKSMIPSDLDVYVAPNMDADHLMLVDSSQAAVQLTEQPLMLETDRIISKKLQETYASIVTGFANVQRDGRLIIDVGEDIATTNFDDYSWLAIN